LRNSVGDEGGEGGGQTRGCLSIVVLILIQKPGTKQISCKGQALRQDTPAFTTRYGVKQTHIYLYMYVYIYI